MQLFLIVQPAVIPECQGSKLLSKYKSMFLGEREQEAKMRKGFLVVGEQGKMCMPAL